MSSSTPYPLALSGELSLRNIAELRTTLEQALVKHPAIAIDTAGVESADVGALQLLLAAQKSADASGARMSLTASAAGPFGRALIAAGLVAADGRALVPLTNTWTLTAEAR